MKLNKINISIIFPFLIIILPSCSQSNDPNYDNDIQTFNSKDVKGAIELANNWKETKSEITSYITPAEVVIKFPDGREVKKQLPADSMYIAVAPYINYTHTCTNHYPSSCQAELNEQVFFLTAKDNDNNILYTDNITSLKNGFFELWLPKGRSISMHITYNSLAVDETITTNPDSKTCITTARLK